MKREITHCPKHPRYRGATKPYHKNCPQCAAIRLKFKADREWKKITP